MKLSKLCLLLLSCSFIGTTHAQILKNLARTAEKAAERALLNRADAETEKSTDRALDSVWGVNDNADSDRPGQGGPDAGQPSKDYNTAKLINTEVKRSFYTHDVVIHTVNKKGVKGSHYFDADELALKGTTSTADSPIYIDSEAFQYGYNEHTERWEKTGLMRTDAMSFMLPMLSIGMVKLPPEPMLEAVDRFKEQGLLLNTFLIVEWAFIYSPDDFRVEGFDEKQVACEDGADCVAFYYEEPGYEGSYVQFDKQGRLSKIVAKVNTQNAQEDGTFDFYYNEPVTVHIPDAVEVKSPMQDLFFKGLDVDD